MAKRKRQTKKLEIWAKLMPAGISIPNPANRARLALLSQKMPPDGENVKLTIAFTSKAKSTELMGFYWGGLLPLWIAHSADLVTEQDLQKNPLHLRDLCRKKIITKEQVDDAHDDLMTEFRPRYTNNLITGKKKTARESLSDMNGYEAALYITEVTKYIDENTGIILNTKEYKKARDTIELIVQQGPEIAKDIGSVDYPKDFEPHTAFD